MNLSIQANPPSSLSLTRRGISLFEVLISMLVASIGVFGVLVLIPFAVKTAQRGLDQEAAITHGRNFFADFEAFGYRNTDRWMHVVDDGTGNPIEIAIDPNAVYLIDPLRVARARDFNVLGGTGNSDVDAFSLFPFTTDVAAASAVEPRSFFPNELEIPRISLRDALGILPATHASFPNNLSTALGRRIFAAPDDLNFDDSPDNEIAGPTQEYFEDLSGAYVKRQYAGKISCMVFAQPDRAVDGQWLLYTVVMKNRIIEPIDLPPLRATAYDPGIASPNPFPIGLPRVFEVRTPAPAFNNTTLVGYGGGDCILAEMPYEVQTDDVQLRRNDWMILINGIDITPPTPEFQAIQNMNFYRVVEADGPDPTGVYQVTLQGPDFNFTSDLGGPQPGNLAPPNTKTYAILIPNVLAVYERTIRPEPESIYD